jgi:hypothetical protein
VDLAPWPLAPACGPAHPVHSRSEPMAMRLDAQSPNGRRRGARRLRGALLVAVVKLLRRWSGLCVRGVWHVADGGQSQLGCYIRLW